MKIKSKIFLASVLSLTGLLLTSLTVYAKTSSEMTLVEITQSYSLYQAAADCLGKDDNNYSTFTPEKAADPSSWNLMAVYKSVGYVDGISTRWDGQLGCGEVFTKGLALWGYTDSGKFLEDIGCTYESDHTLYVCSGDLASNFRVMVKNDIYGGSSPVMKDEMLHLAAMSALVVHCSATQQGIYVNDDSTEARAVEASIADGNSVVIPVLNADNSSFTDYVYSLANPKSSSTLYVGAVSKLCPELARDVRTTSSEFLAFVRGNPGDTSITTIDDLATTAEEQESACAINGVGWIVCPAMSFLGEAADLAFGLLATSFLEIGVNLVATEPTASGAVPTTYRAWAVIRDFANIAFIIAFLIIVFSQVTSVGISNYGIKKMLPRLIIATLLVNASFFICQLAIEISNILGYSLKQVFDNIGGSFHFVDDVNTSGVASNRQIAGVMTLLLAGGLSIYLILSIPVILSVIVAILMTILLLVARKALIVILVVVAPLAFVAYLLPNTEQWFKKWVKMMSGLLMLFPIIAIVFGASSLAADIVSEVGGPTGADQMTDTDSLMRLTAIGIAALPLFLVPSIIKKSFAASGAIGAKLTGWSSKANGRATSGMKSNAKENFKNSRLSELDASMRAGKINRKAARRSRVGGIMGYQHKLDNSRIGTALGFNKGSARASMIVDKADDEDKAAASGQLRNANPTNAELVKLGKGESVKGFNGKDKAFRRAAQELLIKNGTHDEIAELYDHVAAEGSEGERVSFAEAMLSSPKKPKWYTGVAHGSLKAGTDTTRSVKDSKGNLTGFDAAGNKVAVANHKTLIDNAVNTGKYGADVLATGDKGELAAVNTRLRDPTSGVTTAAKTTIIANAQLVTDDALLKGKRTDNADGIERIRTS